MITPRFVEFLIENQLRNSTGWFHEHHDEYEQVVRQPLIDLATQLYDALGRIDPMLTDHRKPAASISRINRDTRYSTDKTIYKDHMWISIKRDKKAFPQYPEFFMGINPDSWEVGCGYYRMQPASQEIYRKMIVRDDPLFLKAQAALEKTDFVFWGTRRRRSLYPDQPPEKRQWLDLRDVALVKESDDADLLFSDRFASYLTEACLSLADVYLFFLNVEERARLEYDRKE